MNRQELIELINRHAAGELDREQFEELQKMLLGDPEARKHFAEQMDLESSLRTWANEGSEPVQIRRTSEVAHSQGSAKTRLTMTRWFALAAMIALALLSGSIWFFNLRPTPVAQGNGEKESPTSLLGAIRQQTNCVWKDKSAAIADHFSSGMFYLTSGVAELKFDSGTDLILEGPCEVNVLAMNSAKLLDGNVVVNVNELSDGFTLMTPEASIIDEGTEYAVSVEKESTEVHVFEGQVVWKPAEGQLASEDRIEAGEARRFFRRRKERSKPIPFGERQFVRRLNIKMQAEGGDDLLAYDGFENPTGRMRPEVNGFGWESGWRAHGRERRLPLIVDAANDEAFGLDRSGRRMVVMENRDDIRRRFEQPITLKDDAPLYVSCLIEARSDSDANHLIQFLLSPEARPEDAKRRPGGRFGFGLTEDGFPFVKSGPKISKTAPAITSETTYFAVFEIRATGDETVAARMRLYHASESIDLAIPSVWTVVGEPHHGNFTAQAIRISVGDNSSWNLDELRVGNTWQAILPR